MLQFFLMLFQRAWTSSVASMGTTTLAIGGGLIYPLGELWKQWQTRGWTAITQHWQERLKLSVLIALIWWALLFAYHLLYKVPQQIRMEAASIATPRNLISRPVPPVGWDTSRNGPNLGASHKTTFVEEPLKDRSDWRRIADWQGVRLLATLSGYPKNKLHIIASSYGEGTWNYALQIREVFLRAGWKVIGPEAAPIDQPAVDIQLSVSEKYWGVGVPPAYSNVESALQSVGIRERKNHIVDPLVPPDELVMWVGAKGPENETPDIHPPLQMIAATCQHPLKFTDTPMKLPEDGARFARSVAIRPARSKFQANDSVLMVLTKPATGVYTDKETHVAAVGKVMPLPDILEITLGKALEINSTLNLIIVSDEGAQVQCVDDYRGRAATKRP